MEFEIYDVLIVPLIIGLVAVAKKSGVPTKALPLLSLAIGVSAGIIYASNGDIKQGVLVGAMLGLSASGLYSGGKTVIETEVLDDKGDDARG